jgi:hypothetical protein
LRLSIATTTVCSILSLTTRASLLLTFSSIAILPYSQLPLMQYGHYPSDVLLHPGQLTVVDQLLGGKTEAQLKKLLMGRLQLFFKLIVT